jgi:hypothetical protein
LSDPSVRPRFKSLTAAAVRYRALSDRRLVDVREAGEKKQAWRGFMAPMKIVVLDVTQRIRAKGFGTKDF